MASFITAGNATNGLQVSSDNTGILELRTGTGSGTTAVTVNASQNVGIGTTTPNQRLNVAGAISSSGSLQGFISYDRATNALSTTIYTPNAGDFRIYDNVANVDRVQIDTSGNLQVVSSAKLGYGTGSGGTVTQTTNKSTAVTLNKPTGQITMSNAALAAGASVTFSFANSSMTTLDTMIAVHSTAGGTAGAYAVQAITAGAGAANIRVTNISGGSLSEAVVINFTIIKGATA